MKKPLSQKTLERKYAELGLPSQATDLLHTYFRCFSNLYGVISVRDAWNVFRHYEGIHLLHKTDFVAFSGIVQREAGHPYSVFELKEVYSGESSEDPLERLIVNNKIVGTDYGKFKLVWNTVEQQGNKPYYLPDKKESFLENREDLFFRSQSGIRMLDFLKTLKTTGTFKGFRGETIGDILDIEGNSVKGKTLDSFVFYTQYEQDIIRYYKDPARKERLREEYRMTALEKVLYWLVIELQTGGYLAYSSPAEGLEFMLDLFNQDLGIELTDAQYDRFFQLYVDMNNHSHLWLNCGWSPHDFGHFVLR